MTGKWPGNCDSILEALSPDDRRWLSVFGLLGSKDAPSGLESSTSPVRFDQVGLLQI